MSLRIRIAGKRLLFILLTMVSGTTFHCREFQTLNPFSKYPLTSISAAVYEQYRDPVVRAVVPGVFASRPHAEDQLGTVITQKFAFIDSLTLSYPLIDKDSNYQIERNYKAETAEGSQEAQDAVKKAEKANQGYLLLAQSIKDSVNDVFGYQTPLAEFSRGVIDSVTSELAGRPNGQESRPSISPELIDSINQFFKKHTTRQLSNQAIIKIIEYINTTMVSIGQNARSNNPLLRQNLIAVVIPESLNIHPNGLVTVAVAVMSLQAKKNRIMLGAYGIDLKDDVMLYRNQIDNNFLIQLINSTACSVDRVSQYSSYFLKPADFGIMMQSPNMQVALVRDLKDRLYRLKQGGIPEGDKCYRALLSMSQRRLINHLANPTQLPAVSTLPASQIRTTLERANRFAQYKALRELLPTLNTMLQKEEIPIVLKNITSEDLQQYLSFLLSDTEPLPTNPLCQLLAMYPYSEVHSRLKTQMSKVSEGVLRNPRTNRLGQTSYTNVVMGEWLEIFSNLPILLQLVITLSAITGFYLLYSIAAITTRLLWKMWCDQKAILSNVSDLRQLFSQVGKLSKTFRIKYALATILFVLVTLISMLLGLIFRERRVLTR